MPVSKTAFDLAADLIKQFEGCSLRPYRDPVGLWTIGWGHLLTPDVNTPVPDVTLTEEQAEALLRQDMLTAANIIARLVKVPLNDGQLAALLSWVFNLGWNLRGSTLLARLNRGDYAGAADQFPRWVYSKGRKLPGLIRRRAAERAIFLGGAQGFERAA